MTSTPAHHHTAPTRTDTLLDAHTRDRSTGRCACGAAPAWSRHVSSLIIAELWTPRADIIMAPDRLLQLPQHSTVLAKPSRHNIICRRTTTADETPILQWHNISGHIYDHTPPLPCLVLEYGTPPTQSAVADPSDR